MKKLLILLLLICGAAAARAETFIVLMTRFNTFDPRDITINVGDTIIWTNVFRVEHDTVAYSGLWASELLAQRETFSFTFTTAGKFDYKCTPHEALGMVGSVTVIGAPNNPPTATITAPANNATFQFDETVNVAAQATDDGAVSQVELLVDGAVAQIDTTAPYTFALNLAAGSHILTARATDDKGLTGDSPPVTINIQPPNQPPSVSITTPSDGSTFTAPAELIIEATASDDNGVTHVDFLINGSTEGSDQSSPYTFSRIFPAGTYRISAIAHDAAGLTGTAAEITIQVNEPLPSAPLISIVEPAQNSYVEFHGTNILLKADAVDLDGAITRVEFREGTNSLGNATQESGNRFEVSAALAEGRHTITAAATDNAGITTVSDPVAFTLALRPEFTSRAVLTNGVVRLSVFGTSAVPFIFEYSEDMTNWIAFRTNALVRRILFFDDESATGRTNRMYRARSPDTPSVE